jgi:hypothetical protein
MRWNREADRYFTHSRVRCGQAAAFGHFGVFRQRPHTIFEVIRAAQTEWVNLKRKFIGLVAPWFSLLRKLRSVPPVLYPEMQKNARPRP